MKGISAYILDGEDRTELTLWHFPPRFEKFIGHHVTYQFGSSDKDPLPPGKKFEVVGYAAVDGLEALVVAVDGTIQRPDGGTYHITWTLDPGKYSPKDSNTVIKNNGYTELEDKAIEIKMKPVFLPFK
jgi:hypothetical protein